ncbi:Short-chain dehydrogenase TIC 32, chloroplastic [Linum perenne]
MLCFPGTEEGVNITANSLHPGVIATNLLRHTGVFNGKILSISPSITNTVGKFVMKNVQQGAATTCYVALHPQVKGVSGEYFSDSNIHKATILAKDEQLGRKLWDFSLDLINPFC